jgi:hypothetical protein
MAYECDMREACADEPSPVAANKLVTNLDNGSTFSACDADWLLFCTAVARQAEAQAAAPDPAPEPTDDTDEDDDEDAAAVARVESVHPAATEPLGVETVVKRGTSNGRRAHEAKKRAAATAAEGAGKP